MQFVIPADAAAQFTAADKRERMKISFKAARDLMVEDENGLKLRPCAWEVRDALESGQTSIPVTDIHFEVARAEADRQTRFRMFCEEDGIVNCRKVRPDGKVEIYQPDAMGWPTVVLVEGEDF